MTDCFSSSGGSSTTKLASEPAAEDSISVGQEGLGDRLLLAPAPMKYSTNCVQCACWKTEYHMRVIMLIGFISDGQVDSKKFQKAPLTQLLMTDGDNGPID